MHEKKNSRVKKEIISIQPTAFANSCRYAEVDYALRVAAVYALPTIMFVPACVPSTPGFKSSGDHY